MDELNKYFINKIDEIPIEIISRKTSKYLIQYPCKLFFVKHLLYKIFDNIDIHFPVTKTNPKNSFRKAKYIASKMIYIVEPNQENFIYTFCSSMSLGSLYSNCLFKHNKLTNPETFDYWNLPERYFDVIISTKPVRLEFLKNDGILIF